MDILTKVEIDNILDFKNKKCADNDDIRYKEIIKQTLWTDNRIIFLLNNKELEDEMDINGEIDGSIYVGKNILPYYFLPNTQTTIKNYICYDSSFEEISTNNDKYKYGLLVFYIMCDIKDILYKGIARHDLISQVIIDDFNWSHIFDTQIHLISNKSSITDSNYATRTLIFSYTKPNSIIKTERDLNNELKNKIINNSKGLD